nr:restriction endonuclease subunit S [Ruminococcus bromii]
MARAKKEAALTPEERLQAALVPDWEWPYKLPENWCWLKLVESFDNHTDSKKKIKQKDYLVKGKLAVVDQGQELIGGYTNDVEKSYSGALPIVIFGDHTRCIKFVDFPFAQGADGVKVLRPKPFYLPKAFYYALQSVNIPNLGYRRHFPLFNKFSIPLPPFAEQQRIVDRIESLFAKLDEAKEKAQAVVDSFETRKAAILHKAFTGELTAKWRKEHGVGMESWEVRTLDSVCSSIFDGDHMPPPKAESGIPFLVISNVNTGHLTFENTRFVPQEYYDTLSDTRKPQLGDVLYTLVGSFGIPVVVNSKRPFCFQRHMALLRPIDVSPQFLWYILQTPEMYDKASSIATGTAQLTVPIKGLRAMTIPRPNIAEQVEIVRILDGFFAREQSAKEAAEAVLDQINLMKKSILARAFRGELGTNDPSEESAVELLKQII